MKKLKNEKEIIGHVQDVLELHDIKSFILIVETEEQHALLGKYKKESVFELLANSISMVYPMIIQAFNSLFEDDEEEEDIS